MKDNVQVLVTVPGLVQVWCKSCDDVHEHVWTRDEIDTWIDEHVTTCTGRKAKEQ